MTPDTEVNGAGGADGGGTEPVDDGGLGPELAGSGGGADGTTVEGWGWEDTISEGCGGIGAGVCEEFGCEDSEGVDTAGCGRVDSGGLEGINSGGAGSGLTRGGPDGIRAVYPITA